jgi:hypothetical protein
MVVVLAGVYAASPRLVLTVLVGGLVVSMAAWALAPHLATARNGDPTLLAGLDHQQDRDMLHGFHHVAVARVDLDSKQPVTLAGLGANATTPMEIGSLTKAMTGVVIIDAVRRGELRLDLPVSTYLPQLAGSPAGTVTMTELVTHTAGYVEFGAATLCRAAWTAPIGWNFLDSDLTQMIREARSGTLTTRGHYVYSTLGSATAGQAVAAAAGMSYPDLMRTRLFEPLGMSHTAIQTQHSLVPSGRSTSGLPVQPGPQHHPSAPSRPDACAGRRTMSVASRHPSKNPPTSRTHTWDPDMTLHQAVEPNAPDRIMAELPPFRLNLMRVGYALMGVGLAFVKWPLFITHPEPWPLFEGVVTCILTAMSLLAFLGLRYPVRMVPILLFECLWKLIWLSVVAVPTLAAGTLDAATQAVMINCLVVVVILAVVPWRHVWHQYATARGDRWR